MKWHDRDDVWFGLALLRPETGAATDEFGGAYVSFAVVSANLRSAIDRLGDYLNEEHWEVSSIEKMKRASDYEHDGEDASENGISYASMLEVADRWGVWLGSVHTFPKNAQKPQ